MVRLHRPRPRRGLRGKLTSDPLVIAAGVAAFLGVDPRWVLDSPLDDWPIIRAVLNEGTEQRVKHDEAIAKFNANLAANRIVTGVGKTLNGLMKAWAKAQPS